MTLCTFDAPIMGLANNVILKKAKLINDQYKLDVKELDAAEKLEFVSEFIKLNANLDQHIQEYLDIACKERSYGESLWFGGWNE